MPVRLVVPLPQIQGRITSMPGYLTEDKALGMKVVTYFQNNPEQNLPAILATVMLFSAATGKIIAVMDGSYITAIRTACASAMATRALANPEAPVLGILGAGVQARAHIQALCQVRKLNQIKLYSPSGTSAANIKRELEPALGVAIDVAKSAEETVRNSDLVVTATTAQQPILKSEWLKPGAHINAVGSHRPDSREIDGPTVAQSKVVVDSREAIMAECGRPSPPSSPSPAAYPAWAADACRNDVDREVRTAFGVAQGQDLHSRPLPLAQGSGREAQGRQGRQVQSQIRAQGLPQRHRRLPRHPRIQKGGGDPVPIRY